MVRRSGYAAHGGVIVGPSGRIVACPPATIAQTAPNPAPVAWIVNATPHGHDEAVAGRERLLGVVEGRAAVAFQ